MVLGRSFAKTLTAARKGREWAWTRIYEELAPAVTEPAGADRFIPCEVVIDGRGIIRHHHVGPIMRQDVDTVLAELGKAQ